MCVVYLNYSSKIMCKGGCNVRARNADKAEVKLPYTLALRKSISAQWMLPYTQSLTKTGIYNIIMHNRYVCDDNVGCNEVKNVMYHYHPDLVCIVFLRSHPYILLHFYEMFIIIIALTLYQ